PCTIAINLGIKTDPLGRFDMPHRKRQSNQRLAYAAEHRLIDSIRPLTEIVESAPLDYPPRADTLLHGDLYARHLLVDETAQLCGVIDWGDIHIGDPAHDLAIVLTLLPAAARSDFLKIYGPIDGVTWTLAKFRAVNHTTCVMHYA